MKLSIGIYASLDRIISVTEIHFPHNAGVINFYLRNWKHFEGLQIIKRIVIK